MNDSVTVVGRQVLDFPNKETGERIQGVNLFIIRPDENVYGLKALKMFIGIQSAAYQDALNLNLTSPVQCVFDYQYTVGQSKPILRGIKEV